MTIRHWAVVLLLAGSPILTNCDSSTHHGTSAYSSEEEEQVAEESESEYATEETASGDEAEEFESSSGSSGNTSVEYSNPNTGYSAAYDLDVDRDASGEVERINFSNGGYIDDSHIVDQEHNGDGTITVTTDEGTEFTVDEE